MINCQHVMSVQKVELFFLRQSENKLIYYGKSRYKKRDLLSLATTVLINFRVPVWAFLIIYTMRFLFGYINTTFFWQRTTLLNLLSISITKKNFLTEFLDMCRIISKFRTGAHWQYSLFTFSEGFDEIQHLLHQVYFQSCRFQQMETSTEIWVVKCHWCFRDYANDLCP